MSFETLDETSHILDDLFGSSDGILTQQKEFDMCEFDMPALSYDDVYSDSFLDIDINLADDSEGYSLQHQTITTPSVECVISNTTHSDHLYSKSPLEDTSSDIRSPASSGYESEAVTSPPCSEQKNDDDVVQEMLAMLCQTNNNDVSTINFDDLDPNTLYDNSSKLFDVLSAQQTDNVIDLDDFDIESDMDNEDSNDFDCADETVSEKDTLPFTMQDIKKSRKSAGNKLRLSDEEKMLLAKEGVELPTDVPLTKEEEKMLKSVRRKIRNKISAKVSRKRKQEYVDGLEKRVKLCTSQNQQLQLKVQKLEKQNSALMAGLKNLYLLFTNQQQQQLPEQQQQQQQITSECSIKSSRPTKTGTCFMVLMLSFALIGIPMLNPFSSDPDLPANVNSKPVVTDGSRRLLAYNNKETESAKNTLFMVEVTQPQTNDLEEVKTPPTDVSYTNTSSENVANEKLLDAPHEGEQKPSATNDSYSIYYSSHKVNEL